MHRTESLCGQVEKDTERRDNGIRLEMADEQKQMRLQIETYDEKIAKIMQLLNDNKQSQKMIDNRIANLRETTKAEVKKLKDHQSK